MQADTHPENLLHSFSANALAKMHQLSRVNYYGRFCDNYDGRLSLL
jgi:hypothetical protein